MRWLLFIVVLIGVAWVAGQLAGNPGTVTLEWLGYRVDSSVAILIVAVAVVAAVVALAYRLWWSILKAPRAWLLSRRSARRARGYEALSRGLVAVAAGDADAARRQARRAEALVNDRPLTLLLSAQTAQLEGDEKSATELFTAMVERHDTEFLGVRGLLTQAIKREDWDEALKLARRAHRLKPKSEWVAETLYDLQKRAGAWAEAEETLRDTEKKKLISGVDAKRERAELHLKLSTDTKGPDAVAWARKALKADPSFVKAAVRLAELLTEMGRHRRAAGVIEDMWSRNPDPDLAEAYFEARRVDDAKQKVLAAQRLARQSPKHLESRLLVATAALDASQWAVARAQLEPVASDDAPPRVCRLMAQLEEGEHGDIARSRMWLMRATENASGAGPQAPPPPDEPETKLSA